MDKKDKLTIAEGIRREKEKKRIEEQNKKEIDKMKNIILNGIEELEGIRLKGLEDKRIEKIFKNNFDEIISSVYNSIFSTSIASLSSSFETSFKLGIIKEKEFNDLMNFISPWVSKSRNDNINITKEDYTEFKNDVKKANQTPALKGLSKVVNRIEEQLEIKELTKEIDDYVQKMEKVEIKKKVAQMKILDKDRRIREEAEKEVYGKVRSERTPIKDKEEIFRKFGNKCAVCGEMEGLHIHHKDKDPSNNVSDNLIVLCGVCHKKIHMKAR